MSVGAKRDNCGCKLQGVECQDGVGAKRGKCRWKGVSVGAKRGECTSIEEQVRMFKMQIQRGSVAIESDKHSLVPLEFSLNQIKFHSLENWPLQVGKCICKGACGGTQNECLTNRTCRWGQVVVQKASIDRKGSGGHCVPVL